MDVYVGGKRKVSLHRADFKAQGGEGSIYVKGKTAFKVYSDPQKVIPHAKIQQLAALSRPEIIRPQEILLDAAQTPVGYTMPCVPNALPLCQTFNKAFRDRQRLTPDRALALVRKLQEGVSHVHAQGLLIVDLNETNFLVDAALDRLYFIDVDSYQTPQFPATALMDSVRDRHAQTFSAQTDWFSFAIVSFQMFVGIHPYKGKHDTLKTLDARMQANVSVLNPDVSVPAVCLSLDVIPPAYRQWYRAVLDDGQRCAPPSSPNVVVIVAPPAVRPAPGVSLFDIEELQAFGSDVVQFAHGLTIIQEGVIVGGRPVLSASVRIGIAPQNGHAIAAWVEDNGLRLYDLHAGYDLPCDIPAEDVMATDGRLYVKQGPSLLEIGFLALPLSTLVSAKIVASVLENATQLFEGVALMNMLGAWYATLLPARGKAYQLRIPELDGSTIVDTKFQDGVIMVIAEQKGRYDKLILRFAGDYQTYDLRRIVDVPAPNINFVALDTGVCLHLNENDELEIFAHRKNEPDLKVLPDAVLRGDCRLFKNGAQALFARGGTLSKFAMRKP